MTEGSGRIPAGTSEALSGNPQPHLYVPRRIYPTVDGFRGAVGRMVYRRQNGGTVVYAPSAAKARRPTAGQKGRRQRFQEAQADAAEVLSHPLRRANTACTIEVTAPNRAGAPASVTLARAT